MHIPQLKTGFSGGLAGLMIAALACGYGPTTVAASPKVKITLAATVDSPLNNAYMKEFQRRITAAEMVKAAKTQFEVSFDTKIDYKNATALIRSLSGTDGLVVLTPTSSFGYYTARPAEKTTTKVEADAPPLDMAQAAVAFGFEKLSGVTIIGHFVTGPETYVTKKAIKMLPDLKGLKFRVEPSMRMVSLDAFNAFAIPYVFNKKVAVNESTRYDGAIMPTPEEVSGFWKKQTPNLVFNNAAYTSTIAMVSTKWFYNLYPDARKTLLFTTKEMDRWAAESSLKRIRKAAEKWRKIGGTVSFIHPPAEQTQIDQIKFLPSDKYTKPAFKELYSSILKDLPADKANKGLANR